MDNKHNTKTLVVTKTGILCAAAIILSAVENAVPALPYTFPGIKLGLSNIAVLFALETMGLPAAVIITLFKALFTLLTRGFTAGLLSLSGGLCSVAVMYLIIRFGANRFGYIGLGIAGAFFHNAGQLLVTYGLVGGSILYYLAVLSLTAIITGCLTGTASWLLIPRLKAVESALRNST